MIVKVRRHSSLTRSGERTTPPAPRMASRYALAAARDDSRQAARTMPSTDAPAAAAALERSRTGERFQSGLALFFVASALGSLWRMSTPAWATASRGPQFASVALFLGCALFLAYSARVAARLRVDDVGVHRWSARGWRTLRWTEVADVRFAREHGGIIFLCGADGRAIHFGLIMLRDPAGAVEFVRARTRHAAGNREAQSGRSQAPAT